MNYTYMGIDIGGTTIKFGVFTKEGELLKNGQYLQIFLEMARISFLIFIKKSRPI